MPKRRLTHEEQETLQALKRATRRFAQGKVTCFVFVYADSYNEKTNEVGIMRVGSFYPAEVGYKVLEATSGILQQFGPKIKAEVDAMANKSTDTGEGSNR